MTGHLACSSQLLKGVNGNILGKTDWLLVRVQWDISSLSERYFQGKVYLKSERAHGHLFFTQQVPEVFEFRTADWRRRRRSTRATFSLSYRKQFSLSIWRMQREDSGGEFLKRKDKMKTRKSQAVTWVLGNNILRSIFTADLSREYRKSLQLIYAISILLCLAASEGVGLY